MRYSAVMYWLRRRFALTPKEEVLDLAMQFVKNNRMCGGYFEFGVWKGDSFIKAFHLAQRYKLPMEFHAFDSFVGLPELKGMDKESMQFFKGKYAFSVSDFANTCEKAKVDMDKIHIKEGFYGAKTKAYIKNQGKAAIIYMDSDLYESTVTALDCATSLIQEGTIIIFDDWYCFKGNMNKGEAKAFSEWLTKNKFGTQPFRDFGWHGKAFVVWKK